MRRWRQLRLSMVGFLPVLLLLSVDGLAQSTYHRGAIPYRDQCASCHGQDAAAFARRKLKSDGSRVMLNRSSVLLEEFLLGHGRADKRARQELDALFLRLLSEGKGP